MKTDLGDVPCAGYASEKFDFPALHATLPQTTRDLLDVMIESAVTAESDPSANRFCTIVIVGHSDRVDSAGVTSEQRRAKELEASTLRAESARAWFFEELFKRLISEGFVGPVDLASMRNVDILVIASGSAQLEKKTPASENDRRVNRRVHFIGTIFTPEAAAV